MEETVILPEDIEREANAVASSIIPIKSKHLYEKEFTQLNHWIEEKNISGIDERVLLAYFGCSAKKLAPSTLWTRYSMLKTTIKLYKDIDISKYGKLTAFLKSNSRGHKPKKAKVLERAHIEKFLKDAPEIDYLMMKVFFVILFTFSLIYWNYQVALLMGLCGACRCDELTHLTMDSIKDRGSYLIVSIPDTKTYVTREFTVVEEGYCINALALIRKYISLRPEKVSIRRFFLNYRKGRCTVQPVGINTLSKIPRNVAKYLNLPQSELYTGHSLRRSSATLLVNAGADLTTLKRHGGWKSSTVAEGYIEESVANKIDIAKKIQGNKPREYQQTELAEEMHYTETPSTSVNAAINKSATVTIRNEEDTQSSINKHNPCVVQLDININVNVTK